MTAGRCFPEFFTVFESEMFPAWPAPWQINCEALTNKLLFFKYADMAFR